MPRRPRSALEGEWFHVGARGNDGRRIYVDDEDRIEWVRRLDDACSRCGVRLVAFDLLPNHFHLVVRAEVKALSQAMHLLQGGYARWSNARHGRRDHLFGDRYWAGPIKDLEHRVRAIRYVLRNAARAGIWASPTDDPWSSLRMTLGSEEPLLALDAAAAVAQFGGVDEASSPSCWRPTRRATGRAADRGGRRGPAGRRRPGRSGSVAASTQRPSTPPAGCG